MNIFIENPADQTLVTVKNWKKSKKPFEAKYVILMVSDTEGIRISKNECAAEHKFKEAQAAAAEVLAPDGQSMRCPTRKECLDIYDARFQGLDEAIKIIGGQELKLNNDYIWTNESDTNPLTRDRFAYSFDAVSGEMYVEHIDYMRTTRPVSNYQSSPDNTEQGS